MVAWLGKRARARTTSGSRACRLDVLNGDLIVLEKREAQIKAKKDGINWILGPDY